MFFFKFKKVLSHASFQKWSQLNITENYMSKSIDE